MGTSGIGIRGQETLKGEDHHRSINRRARRMDGRDPITREIEEETMWGRCRQRYKHYSKEILGSYSYRS